MREFTTDGMFELFRNNTGTTLAISTPYGHRQYELAKLDDLTANALADGFDLWSIQLPKLKDAIAEPSEKRAARNNYNGEVVCKVLGMERTWTIEEANIIWAYITDTETEALKAIKRGYAK